MRTNSCTSEDLENLKSREIAPDIANYPTQALHVYRLNTDVGSWNALMLDNLAPESAQYTIKAIDSIAGQTSHICLSRLSDKRSETGGLHSTLKLAVRACVMLTANVDVSDGLVNGARGEVVHIVTDSDNQVTTIPTKFDNDRVGVFLAKGKQGSEVTRFHFPLTFYSMGYYHTQGSRPDT